MVVELGKKERPQEQQEQGQKLQNRESKRREKGQAKTKTYKRISKTMTCVERPIKIDTIARACVVTTSHSDDERVEGGTSHFDTTYGTYIVSVATFCPRPMAKERITYLLFLLRRFDPLDPLAPLTKSGSSKKS